MKKLQPTILFLKQISTIALIWICVFQIVSPAIAQEPILIQTYNFSKKSYTLYELSKTLQQQSDISISFDAAQLKSNTKIQLPKSTMNIKALTVLLHQKYNIQTKIIGRHVILQKISNKALIVQSGKKKQKQNTDQTKRITKKSKAKKDSEAISKITEASGIDSNTTKPLAPLTVQNLDTVVFFKDTLAITSNIIQSFNENDTTSAGGGSGLPAAADRLTDPDITEIAPPWYERFKMSFAVDANEHFYLNPTLQVNYLGAFVMSSVAIRGGQTHLRYGLGYSHRFSQDFSLSLWANYGQFNGDKNIYYSYDSTIVIDSSLNETISINGNAVYKLSSQLLKVGLNGQWKINPRFEVFGGIVFNQLQTQITSNGVAATPRALFPTAIQPSEVDFELLPKVGAISNNYSINTSQYTREWIGFQIGLRLYIFQHKYYE